MATISVHPVQREFAVADGQQVCRLCGAEERWTAHAEPPIQGPALQRTLHLVHLVRAHLADVQATFSAAERKKEITVHED
ncbi:MAG: hypothetical protein JO272_05615 [Pseudonocardiales bacterium]|nr:hypothetical protein [Pseudonocardiales bacterium]